MIPVEWVLALMMKTQATHPHRATYEKTSEAIARHASSHPLFSGEHGDAKTAALLVGVATFESGLKPDAEGDCTLKGTHTPIECKNPNAIPHSFCLLQVNETNFAGFHITRADIQTSIDVCVSTGLSLMHQSFGVCRALPLEDRLRWYASGGDGCPTNEDATKKSHHRILKGQWLFKALPPTW